jgi:hypothetical protein
MQARSQRVAHRIFCWWFIRRFRARSTLGQHLGLVGSSVARSQVLGHAYDSAGFSTGGTVVGPARAHPREIEPLRVAEIHCPGEPQIDEQHADLVGDVSSTWAAGQTSCPSLSVTSSNDPSAPHWQRSALQVAKARWGCRLGESFGDSCSGDRRCSRNNNSRLNQRWHIGTQIVSVPNSREISLRIVDG